MPSRWHPCQCVYTVYGDGTASMGFTSRDGQPVEHFSDFMRVQHACAHASKAASTTVTQEQPDALSSTHTASPFGMCCRSTHHIINAKLLAEHTLV